MNAKEQAEMGWTESGEGRGERGSGSGTQTEHRAEGQQGSEFRTGSTQTGAEPLNPRGSLGGPIFLYQINFEATTVPQPPICSACCRSLPTRNACSAFACEKEQALLCFFSW
jgi:hypothetical protein